MTTLLLHLLRIFPFLFGGHRQLALENLALRQQLAVYKRTRTRPRIRTTDRVPSTYSPHWLTPLAGGIRDGAHPRGAPPPHCPGSAAAHSVARVRPWPMIGVSGSRCSSRRTSTGSPADAVRRSPRHGQGIPVESIQSPALHKRFARASVAQ